MSKGKDSQGLGQSSTRSAESDKPLPPREKLPNDLQKLVDDEDSLLDQVYDGT